MEKLIIKNIQIYSPIYELMIDLLHKYSLNNYCEIICDGEYEMYNFSYENDKKISFCITVALNIKYECRITFLYGIGKVIKDNKNYKEFSDTYIDNIEQVKQISKSILSFISNKVVIKEYYLRNKKIGDNLNYYFFGENNVKFMDSSYKPLFILPWNRKKIKIKECTFEPWIESEFTI